MSKLILYAPDDGRLICAANAKESSSVCKRREAVS
jgi:hypothetical protein